MATNIQQQLRNSNLDWLLVYHRSKQLACRTLGHINASVRCTALGHSTCTLGVCRRIFAERLAPEDEDDELHLCFRGYYMTVPGGPDPARILVAGLQQAAHPNNFPRARRSPREVPGLVGAPHSVASPMKTINRICSVAETKVVVYGQLTGAAEVPQPSLRLYVTEKARTATALRS